MLRALLGKGEFRFRLFRYYYAIFLLLILTPTIVASVLVHTYVVGLIEREVDKSSSILIGQSASDTDKLVDELQGDMIGMLDYPGLERYVRAREELDRMAVNEIMTGLFNRLQALDDHALAGYAFLFFPESGLVVDSFNGHFDQSMFFQYTNRFVEDERVALRELYNGRQMMTMSAPMEIDHVQLLSRTLLGSGEYIYAVVSYPFNAAVPSAYLTVAIDTAKLQRQIAIDSEPSISTAVMNASGDLLAYAGTRPLGGERLHEALLSGGGAAQSVAAEGRRYNISYDQSSRYQWTYVAIANMNQLRQPVATLRTGSVAFVLFMLLAGAIASYYLSRRVYTPIRGIAEELAVGPQTDGELQASKDTEFARIRRRSSLLVREHKSMQALISGTAPVVHEHFLGKLLSGELKDELAVAYYGKEIGLDARSAGPLAVLCVEFNWLPVTASWTETDRSFHLTELKNEIGKELEVWFCRLREDQLACIVHLADDASTGPQTAASVLVRQLQRHTAFYHAAIGVGGAVGGAWQLHVSCRQAQQLLRRRRLVSGVDLCVDAADWEERSPVDSFLPAAKVGQLLEWYRAGQYERMLEDVERLLDEKIPSDAPAEEVRLLCVDVLNTWLRAMAADSQADYGIEHSATLYRQVQACATREELKQLFRRTCGELAAAETEQPPERFAGVLQQIREHYGSDLTIEQFARELNMSVGHFSRSFKEAVGEKYMDVVLRCRLDAAKRLLSESDLKLDEIAGRVGYLSRNSFIKAFRKQEGITPGKYREQTS
ncbi:AraC family transcriptional regulator [Paenibacillus sp. IB182496]|uniref:AraC family transcriptional regulator n=1 Tax=Paenibacillus sabuli TaxID=2772509 RepID=A0A927BYT5_9BACL|nr:AraC family transcriptional regulator [Paenibacillus sabuli]MBD2847914.1 AraC family transcriptional regulator [Paenibacillus sabuli]